MESQTKMSARKEERIRERVERFRDSNNTSLPAWYHWSLHFVANVVLLGGGIALGFYFGPTWSLKTFALFGGFLAIWSLIEYSLHRFILHGKWFRKTALYKGHAGSHHSYFNHHHMMAEEPNDMNRVMLFTSDLLGLVGVNLLLGAVVAMLLGLEFGALAFMSGMVYITTHEVIHWFCHGERESKWPIVRHFAHHHWIHHNQRLMGKYNFGVVSPVWDWVFRTGAPQEDDACGNDD